MKDKIVINARFLTQPITGVQRYAIEISRSIKKLYPNIEFCSPRNVLHKELAKELDVKIVGSQKGHFWEQFELPFYLKNNGNPKLISLCNTAPVFYKNKISTLHDVAFIKYPKSFSFKFRLFYKTIIPLVIRTSDKLITVSEFSKSEISDVYGYPTNNIHVVYNSASDFFKRQEGNIEKGNYILAVSSVSYQKNFHGLIDAFNLIENKDLKLKIVGGMNKSFKQQLINQESIENKNVIFLGRVDDDELKALYSKAKCFVYPSYYEGFGIPPIEAQSCSCPVIVSDAASLPEVCSDSVIYCDPYSIDDIADKINQVDSHQSLREELIQKGHVNVQRFSWEKSANKIINLI